MTATAIANLFGDARKPDVILLLSGGVDSLVLLARECHEGRRVACVSFDYGQRHRRELDAAVLIARHYNVAHGVLSVCPWALGGSALTGGPDVPRGLHFEDPGQGVTVVPNRNMVFLALAAAVAVRVVAGSVLFAAHAGDAAVYPDCRPAFVEALSAAMVLACGVTVEAPFLALTKRDVVALGRELAAPLELSWSCYEGGERPCGDCGACVERREAFAV